MIPTGSGRTTSLPKGSVRTVSYRPPSGRLCTLTSQVSRSISRGTGTPVSAYARGLSYDVTSTTVGTGAASARSPAPAKAWLGVGEPSGRARPPR